jgi:hypothetical protein
MNPQTMQYLYAAMQSPNINNPAFMSDTTQNSITQSTDTTDTANTGGITKDEMAEYLKNAGIRTKDTETEKESSNTLGWVVGTALTVGAAALCIKAHGKGVGDSTFSKICDGFGKMFSSAKGIVTSAGKKSTKFTLGGTEKGGRYCTVPGKNEQILTGNNITTDGLTRLGLKDTNALLSDSGSKITDFRYKLTYEGKDYAVLVKDGKVKKILTRGADGKLENIIGTYNQEGADNQLRKQVNEFVEKVINKEEGALGDVNAQVSHIRYTNTADNGAVFTYQIDKGTDTTASALRRVSTNRYSIDSDAVKAYRQQHPEFSQKLEQYLSKGKNDGFLSMASAEYQVPSTDQRVIFENGAVKGIWKGDKYYAANTEECRAALFDIKNLDKIAQNPDKLNNIVWKA